MIEILYKTEKEEWNLFKKINCLETNTKTTDVENFVQLNFI